MPSNPSASARTTGENDEKIRPRVTTIPIPSSPPIMRSAIETWWENLRQRRSAADKS